MPTPTIADLCNCTSAGCLGINIPGWTLMAMTRFAPMTESSFNPLQEQIYVTDPTDFNNYPLPPYVIYRKEILSIGTNQNRDFAHGSNANVVPVDPFFPCGPLGMLPDGSGDFPAGTYRLLLCKGCFGYTMIGTAFGDAALVGVTLPNSGISVSGSSIYVYGQSFDGAGNLVVPVTAEHKYAYLIGSAFGSASGSDDISLVNGTETIPAIFYWTRTEFTAQGSTVTLTGNPPGFGVAGITAALIYDITSGPVSDGYIPIYEGFQTPCAKLFHSYHDVDGTLSSPTVPTIVDLPPIYGFIEAGTGVGVGECQAAYAGNTFFPYEFAHAGGNIAMLNCDIFGGDNSELQIASESYQYPDPDNPGQFLWGNDGHDPVWMLFRKNA